MENLPEDADLVVYSEAIPSENIELQEAKNREIPTLTYFEALGDLTADTHLVAIAGTHGKTTTTAMLGLILIEADSIPPFSWAAS